MKKLLLTCAFLLWLPALSAAQQNNAFIDPATGVLKAVGYVDVNAPGEIKIPVGRNFKLNPGEWKWDGKNWTAVTPPLDPIIDLGLAIDAALAAPNVAPEVKIVLLKLRNVLGN